MTGTDNKASHPPRVDLEVVLSAARAIQTNPDLWRLNEFASDVEDLVAECSHLRGKAETVLRMARYGVGPDTTPEQVLATIDNYLSMPRTTT